MQINRNNRSETEVVLMISANSSDLEPIKKTVLNKLSKNVKVPGYREGKVPAEVAEKHINPQIYQTEFLDEAMTVLYAKATFEEKIRPVTKPKVSIKKFVPFTELEYQVETEILGQIKLGKYKNIKLETEDKKITKKDVDNVIKTIQTRMAKRSEVKRTVKNGDEAIIDFKGSNDKNEPIPGSEGKDYPMIIGSKSFIPGFEDNLIGLKFGDKKTFNLKFPDNYGAKALAGTKVTFDVEIKKVNELKKPEVNDEMAKKVGPFKSVDELKQDVKKQLEQEAQNESLRTKQNKAVEIIAKSSDVKIPDEIIDQQTDYEKEEVRRTVVNRGMTYQEFVASEGKTEEEYEREVLRPRAEQQIKVGVLLSEIAEREGIKVEEAEVDMQINILKQQYSDLKMQENLDKSEARRDIASRILSQKVANYIIENAS